jgi:hypothetical protein
MRVLCCLDGTNVGQVSKAAEMLSALEPPTFGLLFVTDTGPRHDIEHLRERFHRHPGPPPPREEEMRQAERLSAQDILDEGLSHLTGAEAFNRQGRPEREIVNTAAVSDFLPQVLVSSRNNPNIDASVIISDDPAAIQAMHDFLK